MRLRSGNGVSVANKYTVGSRRFTPDDRGAGILHEVHRRDTRAALLKLRLGLTRGVVRLAPLAAILFAAKTVKACNRAGFTMPLEPG